MGVRKTLIVAAAIFAAAWLAVIVRHNCEAAGGADSSGYFNEAKLFAEGRLRVPVNVDESLLPFFVPLGFVASHGAIVPMYPPGYPLHLLLFGFLTTPIAALVCLLLMFALARDFAAAVILATTPVFLLMALQPMSDVVSMMWCMAAMLLVLRKRPALAGLAFAIAVWVRPSNLLLAIPLAWALRSRVRYAAAAALPFGIALVVLNHAMYGSWLATGYGSVDYMFAWTNPISRAPQYARWLFPYILGLLVVFDKRVGWETRTLLVVWFGVFFVFYSFFGPIGEWGYTRFLLPAFPPLIIGMLLLLRNHRVVAMVITAILAVGGSIYARREHVFSLYKTESIYPQTVRWAEQRLPRGALVASMQLSGSFFYYANRFTLRYDLIDAAHLDRLPRPIYAVVFDWEAPKLPGGRWRKIDGFQGVSLMQLDDLLGEAKPEHGAR